MSRPDSAAPRRGLPMHWIALAAVAAVLIAFAATPLVKVMRPVRAVHVAAALPVAAAAPTTQPAGRTVQAPGWLEPDPYYTAVTALADGVVESVHALEGESVEKGQIVARLVDDDAKLALMRAEAELTNARADLDAARTDWDQPVERDRQVAAARAQLAEAKAELAQLPSMIEQAAAEARRWAEEHDQIKRAHAGGAANDRELIVAAQRDVAAAAALQIMKHREPVLEARVDRLDAERRAAERAAELRVTERRALDAAKAAVARHEAAVAEAKLRLSRMTIAAPMDARVLRRLVQPGDKVMLAMDGEHSAHIIHLYDPEKIQVRVDVPLADAAHVSVGQRCEVVVDVLPDQAFAGVVTRITHRADLQKNTLQVKVAVSDPSPMLRPEMLTRVKFLAGSGSNAEPSETGGVRVPISCLDGDRVWVVRDRRGLRGRAQMVSVQLIDKADDYATLAAPLHGGDLIIDNPAGLTNDDPVQLATTSGGGA